MLIVAATIAGCNNNPAESGQKSDGDTQNFGAAVTAEHAISYGDLITKMSGVDSLQAKVTGKVSEVCQMSGCWLTVAAEKPEQLDMYVSFKDSGFTVPKNIGGKKVVMEGFAYKEVTSVEDLKQLAAEEGKSQSEIEAIKSPLEEISFEATGVKILE